MGARDEVERSPLAARTFGPFFMAAGAMHFVVPKYYEAIIPDAISPWRRELVVASGIAEILGGLGVLVPRTRRLASRWSVATLVAVFPANVHMALNPDRYDVPGGSVSLYLRLPLQVPVILWAWAAGRD
ncbi:MAG: hypothetical protein ABR518_10065 [Actinomycetota bacterium]